MAKRVLSDSEYESWAAGHSVAENSLGGRERKLHDSYCRIEKNLSLLGWLMYFVGSVHLN